MGQRTFGYAVDAVGEGMEGVTDYVLNNAVQQTYDPSAPQITIGDMMQVLGKGATVSLILGAMPREAAYGANRVVGKGDLTNHYATDVQESSVNRFQTDQLPEKKQK